MTTNFNPSPDEVFLTLKEATTNKKKLATLEAIHKLCEIESQKEFPIVTRSSVGKILEVSGLMKGRALYNAQSKDYVVLIEAWNRHITTSGKKVPAKAISSHGAPEWLTKIEDPVLKQVVQGVLAERNRYLAELNLLKSKTIVQLTIGQGSTVQAQVQAQPKAFLSKQEMTALSTAISKNFLESEGWNEGPNGSVCTPSGSVVYKPGYLTGIKSLLEVCSNPG